MQRTRTANLSNFLIQKPYSIFTIKPGPNAKSHFGGTRIQAVVIVVNRPHLREYIYNIYPDVKAILYYPGHFHDQGSLSRTIIKAAFKASRSETVPCVHFFSCLERFSQYKFETQMEDAWKKATI